MTRQHVFSPRALIPAAFVALALPVLFQAGTSFAGGTIATGANSDQLMILNGTHVLPPTASLPGTSIGDFITDNEGLDEPYRFFLEVAPGTSRLVVEIFDADILAGTPADEEAGDRDLLRTNQDSFARYRLFDPAGNQVPTQFGVGDDDAPTPDNSWVTFYDSQTATITSGDTFTDDFSSGDYTGGTGTWATDWTEDGESGTVGPTGGKLSVSGGELVLTNNPDPSPFINKPGIYREVDLSSYSAATLSFDWGTGTGMEDNDAAIIEVSDDGGVTYTGLDILSQFASGPASGSATYDLSGYLAANTRIRFRIFDFYAGGGETFTVDNLVITATSTTSTTAPATGHWELVVDMSTEIYDRENSPSRQQDELNAFAIRAHDGDSSATGSEVNVYALSYFSMGLNNTGGTRSFTIYPYVTEGCELRMNDFDFDSDATDPDGVGMGTIEAPYGSWDLTSRTGNFTQGDGGTLSANDDWLSTVVSGWTVTNTADEYGIWELDLTIQDFGAGNYGLVYLGNDESANPNSLGGGEPGPSASPEANTFRLYFPTDANAAPAKPYITQTVRWRGLGNGPNPPVLGSTTGMAITISVVNPAGSIGDITFSSPSNLVEAFVPADTAQVDYTYVGPQGGFPTAGTLTPTVNGDGSVDLDWNPGTVASGDTATLVYMVDIEPLVAGSLTIPLTGDYTSLTESTRASFIDETGDTVNSNANFTIRLCEVEVVTAAATPVLVSDFSALTEGGQTILEWSTAAEAGTTHFDLLRHDASGIPRPVNTEPLLAALDSPQGGTYRMVDAEASPGERHTYTLMETTSDGRRIPHGPFTVEVDWSRRVDMPGLFDRQPHAPSPRHEAARRAAQEAPERVAPKPQVEKQFGPDTAVRIDVREPGLQRIALADLSRELFLPVIQLRSLARRGRMTLEHNGEPVAWTLGGNRRANALEFYAPAFDDPRSATAAYRLSFDPGTTMGRSFGTPPAQVAPPGQTFRDRVRVEENLRPLILVPIDPLGDIWQWDFLAAELTDHRSKDFTVRLPAVSDGVGRGTFGTAELALEVLGAAPGQHTFDVDVNGQFIGSFAVQDFEVTTATLDFDQGALVDGDNTVTLTATGGSFTFLDALSVTYDRTLSADGGSLLLRGDGHDPVTVGGFTDSRIRVFDLSDPRRPRLVEAVGIDSADGAFRATFTPSDPSTLYLVVDGTGARTSASLAIDLPSDLRSTSEGADYLVLTTAELVLEAERLAAHRASQGLSTQVVDIQDVYDEFAAGRSDWTAVRDFLDWTQKRWTRAPRFVVLAGAGSYDYHDVLGFGNAIPVPVISDGETLVTTDAPYADPDGDGVPAFALGRLPVLDRAELSALIDKIIAYETTDAGDWADRVIMVADNGDDIADFGADSQTFGNLVPRGFETTSIHLGDFPDVASTRNALLSAFDNGAAVVHYLGHGGIDRLASEGLMTVADVPNLTNVGRTPLMVTVSCHVGHHGLPGFDALGEDLVLAPDTGAIAVVAPSWLSTHHEASVVGDRLLRQIFTHDQGVLGTAFVEALGQASTTGVDPILLRTYQLLGDPALRLQLEPQPIEPPIDGCGDSCGEHG